MGLYCYLVCAAAVELIGGLTKDPAGKRGTMFVFSASVLLLFIYLVIQEAVKGN